MTVCGACGAKRPAGRHCPSCGVGATQAEQLDDWTGPAAPVLHDGGGDPDNADGTAWECPESLPRVVGRRLVGALLVVIGLALIVGGGYTAYQNRHHVRGGLRPGVRPTPSPRPTSAASQPAVAPSPTSTVLATATVTTSLAGAQVPVQVAPALVGQPDVADITDVLSTYFTAINQRDFAAYRSVLVGAPVRSGDEADFLRRFRSTTDSDVRLVGVRHDPDGKILATVTFRSIQDPVDAPDGVSPCVSWVLTYPMTRDVVDQLRIDVVRTFAQTHRPC